MATRAAIQLVCGLINRRATFRPRLERGIGPFLQLKQHTEFTAKLKFDAQCMRELADKSAAEQQHAYDEDHALDDEDPLTDGGEVVLQSNHEERPCNGPEQGAEPADQGHKDDLSRHRPIN